MLRYLPLIAIGLLLAACSDPYRDWAVPETTSKTGDTVADKPVVRNPEILDMMLREYAPEIAWELGEGPKPKSSPEEIRRIKSTIDQISGQVDGWVSGLFWYKSLEAATEVAAETGQPVLMLRLLGNLDDEFC